MCRGPSSTSSALTPFSNDMFRKLPSTLMPTTGIKLQAPDNSRQLPHGLLSLPADTHVFYIHHIQTTQSLESRSEINHNCELWKYMCEPNENAMPRENEVKACMKTQVSKHEPGQTSLHSRDTEKT
ncbi:hypothetical protein M758_UG203000 [Ceratodon purpureus]|nr:hypothetical protein M758_UG203000 [Ceratodon purpureus]